MRAKSRVFLQVGLAVLLITVMTLAGCGGGGGVVPPAQAQELTTAPFTQGVNAFNCTGIPCLTSQARSVSGGLRGNVNTTAAVHRIAVPGTESFEWAFVTILDNHADGGENVAIYGQSRAYAGGPTWGGVFEVMDMGGPKQPNMVGVEINLGLRRPHNGNQLGLHVVGHPSAAGASGAAAVVADGPWESAFRAQGPVGTVIDAWRAQNATVFANLPMPLLLPPSGRHVGNLPVVIGGQTYYIPVFQ